MTRTNREYLFVYGTLMSGFQVPITKQIYATATSVGRAYCYGKLFDVGGYPGLQLLEQKLKVFGELLSIPALKFDNLIHAVDLYEECTSQNPHPHEYVRTKTSVYLCQSGMPYVAWIYRYNRPLENQRHIHSGDYRHYVT